MDDLFGDVKPASSSSSSTVKPSTAQVDEEEYESVLFVARECYVYKLPARTTTAGYKAAEWVNHGVHAVTWNMLTYKPQGDMEAFIWKGRCRVMEYTKGETSRAVVRLEDSNTGELFAQSPYDKSGKAVEAVLDSSRYFVLKVVDVKSGKHAYLGMGFQDRGEAFDFQVALQDWQKRQRAPKEDPDQSSSNSSSSTPAAPKHDFSLKEGQTISVRLGGSSAPTKKSTGAREAGGPIPLLAPPPSVRKR